MSTYIDPLMPLIVLVAFSIFALNSLLKYIKVPSVITYILTGIVLGPYVLNVLQNTPTMALLADLGVTMLLFFIGMEISLDKLLKNWKVSFIGTTLQVIVSVAIMFLLGFYLNWPVGRIILLGFVISLSSTAVILKILEADGKQSSKRMQNILGILVVQDIIAIPMIIILGFFSSAGFNPILFTTQIFGILLLSLLIAYIVKKKEIRLPFFNSVKHDPELQVFTALGLCFGFALITSLLGLSAALGSFVAGVVIASAKESKWVSKSLSPFYVVLLAIFFISIGVIIDISFVLENWQIIFLLTLIAFIVNIVIGYVVLRYLKVNKQDSFYIALLLSHIGEFSYVLAALGQSNQMISDYGYNLIISMISLSLIISPFLVIGYKKVLLLIHKKDILLK